jgi:hypothetical protein
MCITAVSTKNIEYNHPYWHEHAIHCEYKIETNSEAGLHSKSQMGTNDERSHFKDSQGVTCQGPVQGLHKESGHMFLWSKSQQNQGLA